MAQIAWRFRWVLIVLLISWLLWGGFAQYKDKDYYNFSWKKGWVILTSGDTLYGNLTYRINHEIIELKQRGQPDQVYSPVHVKGFIGADKKGNHFYQTYSWTWFKDSGALVPAFFEHVTFDNYSLVRKRSEENMIMPVTRPTSIGVMNVYYLPFIYFMRTPDGSIISLRRLKQNYLKVFGGKAALMQIYAEKNDLNLEKEKDLIRLIKYFNLLTK